MTEHTSPTTAPAKPPVGTGATPLVGQLIALALIGLGVVGVQDLLARTGAVAQQPWIDTALSAVEGLPSDNPWVLVGGVVAALLGLFLVLMALRRRPRKTLELKATTGVRLRRRDLRTLVKEALSDVDGVTDVDVVASRRRLRVSASTMVRDDRRGDVEADLRQRLEPMLGAFRSAPRPSIKLKESAS